MFFVLISTFSFTQTNLVTNPSFEDRISCPNGLADFNAVIGWNSPTLGTPDYFNICDLSTAGIPSNNYGYEYAHSGDAYTGILTNVYESTTNGREYIQARLKQQMEINNLYKISFFVSFADSCLNAANNLGVFMSCVQLSYPTLIDTLPIVTGLNESEIITQTNGWRQINYYYLANGSENYIVIGNFHSNINTNYQPINNSGIDNKKESYYYIDDVSVEKIDIEIANVFSPNNDGVNDFWILNNLPEDTSVEIYNRWGKLLNKASVKGTYKWNGKTIEGQECSEGTYFYLISYKNETTIEKGFLQLFK